MIQDDEDEVVYHRLLVKHNEDTGEFDVACESCGYFGSYNARTHRFTEGDLGDVSAHHSFVVPTVEPDEYGLSPFKDFLDNIDKIGW